MSLKLLEFFTLFYFDDAWCLTFYAIFFQKQQFWWFSNVIQFLTVFFLRFDVGNVKFQINLYESTVLECFLIIYFGYFEDFFIWGIQYYHQKNWFEFPDLLWFLSQNYIFSLIFADFLYVRDDKIKYKIYKMDHRQAM